MGPTMTKLRQSFVLYALDYGFVHVVTVKKGGEYPNSQDESSIFTLTTR